MTENPPLSCLNCAAFCCKLAGYVEVRRSDIRRLAKFLGLTVPEFEAKHIVEKTRKGEKLIKSGYDTCQFLGPDRRCTVYAARPTDCRQYICWDQYDPTVYEYARFFQSPIEKQQQQEEAAREKELKRKAEERQKRQRKAKRGRR